MSKIIEALRESVADSQKKDTGSSGIARNKKTDHELTQEQLADIYFAGPEKVKKSDYPTVIKVIEKSRSPLFLPWLITLAALTFTAVVLYSGKRVFIDVKVLNSRAATLVSPENMPLKNPEGNDGASEELKLGDKLSVKNLTFDGAAKLRSTKDKNSLVLVNSSVAPFARAVLQFDTPVDLSGTKIVFYARGLRGGENIAFALKDKGNVSAFIKNKIYPFANALTTDWQRADILLFNVAKDFDIKNTVSLRFEFGSKDTDNKPGDTILIKDIQVVPL